eukprot:764861-Prymnesium_polylepis.2
MISSHPTFIHTITKHTIDDHDHSGPPATPTTHCTPTAVQSAHTAEHTKYTRPPPEGERAAH